MTTPVLVIGAALLTVGLSLHAPPASAERHRLQGKVSILRAQPGIDTDFVTIAGGSSAGTCKASGGQIVVRIPDEMERAFSILLAAQAAGRDVVLYVDDAVQDAGGFCSIYYVNMAP